MPHARLQSRHCSGLRIHGWANDLVEGIRVECHSQSHYLKPLSIAGCVLFFTLVQCVDGPPDKAGHIVLRTSATDAVSALATTSSRVVIAFRRWRGKKAIPSRIDCWPGCRHSDADPLSKGHKFRQGPNLHFPRSPCGDDQSLFGGRSSPLSQPITSSALRGSSRSHCSHRSERGTPPPGANEDASANLTPGILRLWVSAPQREVLSTGTRRVHAKHQRPGIRFFQPRLVHRKAATLPLRHVLSTGQQPPAAASPLAPIFGISASVIGDVQTESEHALLA